MKLSWMLIAASVLITALLTTCDDEDYPMDKILKLELSDTLNMKANGIRQFTVRAKLPSDASDKYKTVTFSTGSGKFVTSQKETVEEQIDADGIAEANLIVGTEPGIFYVTASIGSEDPKYSVTEKFRLIPIPTSEIIEVTLSDTTGIRADNFSVMTIDVKIDNTPLNVVTVSSSDGVFLASDKDTDNVQVGQDGTASFQLQVGNTPKTYYITTSINEGTRVISKVNVRRAYAESMLIEPASFAIDSATAVSISVFLTRSEGEVSVDTPVFFEAYQLDNSANKIEVGRFTGTSEGTDQDGKVTVSFHADSGNIMPDKPIIIHFSSETDSGGLLEEEIELTFVEED